MEMIIVKKEEYEEIKEIENGKIVIDGFTYIIISGNLYIDYTKKNDCLEQIDYEIAP